MVVALFTSVFFNNIGNGFIDLGAEATLKEALPSDWNLIKMSQCANFAASMGKKFMLKESPAVNWCWLHVMQKMAPKLQDRSYDAVSTLDVNSVPAMVDCDYLIIPGCVLTIPFFKLYGKLLSNKISRGTKLIFLGVSGNFYNENEVNVVTKWLRELKPVAIITRDSVAFELYSKYADRAYNGIDNVFFVNRLGIPNIHTEPDKYVVINLEEPKHNHIRNDIEKELWKQGKKIIYTDHKPFPYLRFSSIIKKGVIVSDYPMDYLLLYKHADAVYSDRVHACIPTLSFGNRVTLFSDSPRKALFNNVGIEKLKDFKMETSILTDYQNKQIEFLSTLFKEEERLNNENCSSNVNI